MTTPPLPQEMIMKDNDLGRRASAEPALVADATGAASVSALSGDGQARLKRCEDVLRGLASYVSAGGYNAETVDPDVFDAKIRWGIDHLRSVLINTPETADFMAGVPLEATHQRQRWGADHDAGKAPEDWFWLIGYLGGKALAAAKAGDITKAKHHTISTAAALANWHAALAGKSTQMRPGIDPTERGLAA